MPTTAQNTGTAQALRAVGTNHTPEVLVGFDAFVDSIIDLVHKRISATEYERIPTIAAYGERISAVAGRSTNIEPVIKQVKLGGNGPIMANALLGHDHRLTYVGILGDGDGHPVFEPMIKAAENVVNLGPCCRTDAYEFEDGKIMMTVSEPLFQLNYEQIVKAVGGPDALSEMLTRSSLVATVNWTQTLGMTDLWESLMEHHLPTCYADRRPLWFVDLADPQRRTQEDLRTAIDTLVKMQKYVDVVLGLNEEEARQVIDVLGGSWNGDLPNTERAQDAAVQIQKASGLHTVVIHFVGEAAAAQASGDIAAIEGFYVAKPKITTGAGDHFNAGFCAGLLADAGLEESLVVGTASSGYYVRTAVSPSRDQLIKFLESNASEI